ncbi:MAG: hypothetical protein QOE01_493 [Actinomycetota bacterium]|jgi:predicted NUDIX family NTP pyrophosphohydrolase|nr:hypothetical protein [Actinomycetota bacterium]
MAVRSAGILLYRTGVAGTEVLLGHMGGPFWARKDDGAWSIPKGEHGEDEEPLQVARREFEEETGTAPPAGPLLALGEATQRNGKLVTVWAVPGDLDPATTTSNTFTMEWPPGSGREQHFPEIDRTGWFDLDTATAKLVAGQRPFVERLRAALQPGTG